MESLGALRPVLKFIAESCRELGKKETGRVLGHRAAILAAYEPALLDLPGGEVAPPAELPPDAARLRLFSFLDETLGGLAAQRRCLVIIDDLQWADELTLDFLQYLAEGDRLARQALLYLASFRPEEAGDSLSRLLDRQPRTLTLQRFTLSAVEGMIQDMLAFAQPPQKFIDSVYHQSKGNPLVISEVLRTALETGRIWRDPQGRWQASEIHWVAETEGKAQEIGLPQAAAFLLEKRLGRLEPDALYLLQVASVLGHEIQTSLLTQVAEIDQAQMLRVTMELGQQELLDLTGDEVLCFAHHQLRQVAYRGIEEEQRKKIHCRAARCLEARGELGGEMNSAVLGEHWRRGGDLIRAQTYTLAAARQAQNCADLGTAERLYRAYLQLSEEAEESVTARLELGHQVLYRQGRPADARLELEEALLQARRVRNWQLIAKVLRALGNVELSGGQVEVARERLEEARALYSQHHDREGRGAVHTSLGRLFVLQGDLKRARRFLGKALRIQRKARDARAAGTTLILLADLHLHQSRVDRARTLYRRALRLARFSGHRQAEGDALLNLAILHRLRGRLNRALKQFEQARDIHRETGDRRSEGYAWISLAILHLDQGRLDEAHDLFFEALRRVQNIGDRRGEGYTLLNFSHLHRARKQWEKSVQLAHQALLILQDVGEQRGEAYALLTTGTLEAEQGQMQAGGSTLERALSLMRQLGDHRGEAAALTRMADLHRRQGKLSSAWKFHLQAVKQLRSARDWIALSLALASGGHILLAQGRSAQKILDRVTRIVHRLKVEPASEVFQAMESLRRAQDVFSAGNEALLVGGERVEDLPPG